MKYLIVLCLILTGCQRERREETINRQREECFKSGGVEFHNGMNAGSQTTCVYLPPEGFAK